MKSIFSVVSSIYSNKRKRNLITLFKLLAILGGLITAYTIAFHYIMEFEGKQYSWIAALYWCLVTMSTLGFGDIIFTSDLGRAFSIIVLLSGTLFMLVILPFFFIQFFFIPLMEAREESRAPRRLDPKIKGHVLLTGIGPIEEALIRRLEKVKVEYAVIVAELSEALSLNDQGYKVMLGDLDDPETYIKAQVRNAALIATTQSDTVNTNVAFTVREVCEDIPIVATANSHASVDILTLAGCNRILELGDDLGRSFARRILGNDGRAHIIGEFDQLLIAEAIVAHPPLIGKSLSEARFREVMNINIVGTWQRGKFALAGPDTVLTQSTVLVLAGSREQIETYNSLFGVVHSAPSHAIIIGGGRVGNAIGKALAEKEISYVIVDKRPERIQDNDHYLLGDAAELEVLKQAGINRASAIVVTTNDDYMNVYLTIYCRRLRPNVQLLGRANTERNITSLHRAGADFVLSYAGTNASTLFNLLQKMDTLLLAEGLTAFRVKVPTAIAGRTLIESSLRDSTGCSVIGLKVNDHLDINIDPRKPLPANGELIIMGDAEAEGRFMKLFSSKELKRL